MKQILLLQALLLLSAEAAVSTGDGSNRCKWLEAGGIKQVTRFSVLPGGGWDNLRNRDMGLVADLSYEDCALSDDGTYVTPSQVILYPKRESQVNLASSLMEHYDNYTSTTSFSVNLGGNGVFRGIGIDGKMSSEFQEVKRRALASRTQIGRTQLRYNLYSAQLQPDFRLSLSFSNRLVDIGNAIINNQTKMARYLSDLVVRDFGTHVITSVDAGAVLEKVDFFNRNSLDESKFTSNKISQCMSVSFAKVYGVSTSVSYSATTEEVQQYVTSVQKTSLITLGGPPMGVKIDVPAWEARLRENLVPVDKMGDPLFGVISERSLPQIPLPYIKMVVDYLKAAVLRYYEANKVKGCQDPNSPNFDPIANLDGACEPPTTNFSFAGVFQTCSESRADLGLGLCGRGNSPMQPNPITGEFRCPAGYEAVNLLTATGDSGERCFDHYKSCWLFFRCFDYRECIQSVATLKASWCSASKTAHLDQQSGMIYGGAYSPRFVNPSTDAKTCGAGYRPYAVGRDISLCLSADMFGATKSRIPLGGLFSCQSGNPLAEPGRRIVALKGFRSAAPPAQWPKRCPDGFSQSTLDLVDGCALMQCTRQAGLYLSRLVVKRPPFEEADFRYTGAPIFTVSSSGRVWETLNASTERGVGWRYLGYFGGQAGPAVGVPASSSGGGGGGNYGINGASIGALVALLAIIGLAILVGLGFALRHQRRRSGRAGGGGGYRQLDEAGVDGIVSADAVDPESADNVEIDEAEVNMESAPLLHRG